jgi:hypothetical protein
MSTRLLSIVEPFGLPPLLARRFILEPLKLNSFSASLELLLFSFSATIELLVKSEITSGFEWIDTDVAGFLEFVFNLL